MLGELIAPMVMQPTKSKRIDYELDKCMGGQAQHSSSEDPLALYGGQSQGKTGITVPENQSR